MYLLAILTKLILPLIILAIFFFVYWFIIRVYFRAQYYRKQGVLIEFKPIIGNSLDLRRATREKGDFCYAAKTLVNLRPKIKMAGNPLYDRMHLRVFNTECIQDILKNPDNYIKAPRLIGVQKILIGEGLILAEGQLWKKHRKYCTMAFHYEMLKRMIPDIYQIAEEFLERLRYQHSKQINIIKEFEKITAEVVGRLFFGQRFCEYKIDGILLTDFLGRLSSQAQMLALDPLNFLLGPEFIKKGVLPKHRNFLDNTKKFRDLATKLVREIIKSLEDDDSKGILKDRKAMIEIFYDQIKANPDDPLSEEELVNLFSSFFVAGMDTTGHLAGIATYFFLKNPNTRPKLMNEINEVFSHPNKVTIENLNAMDYTTAFFKESLRIATPAPFTFPREAKRDHVVGGIKIKKGDILTPNFLAVNFDTDYHDDPQSFNPDRWLLVSMTKKSVSSDPFVFIPFSAGVRTCIGVHLSMLEAKIIFGLFLKKYEFELADSNYSMRYNFRFLYEPDEPLLYNFKPL